MRLATRVAYYRRKTGNPSVMNMSALIGIRQDGYSAPDAAVEAGAVAGANAAQGAITEQAEQRAIQGFQMAVTGKTPTKLDEAQAEAVARNVERALNRTDLPPEVRAQVADALVRVGNGVMDGTIEPKVNNVFLKHLHDLATEPLDPAKTMGGGTTEGPFRGALAQMTRASQLVQEAELAPGTKLTYDPSAGTDGVRRAGLPILDEPHIDADLYYKTQDGALRIESTKYSVSTLAGTLKEGRGSQVSQADRQANWVKNDTAEEPRRMGYFALDKGTGFQALMNDANLKKLSDIIPESDRGTRNIIVGDRKYSLDDLNAMNDGLKSSAARAAQQSPEGFNYREYYKSLGSTPDDLMRSLGKTYGEPTGVATPGPREGTLGGKAAGGALVGAAAGATMSMIHLAADGQLNVHNLGQVAEGTAQGAAVGVATVAVERVAGGTAAGAIVAGAVSGWGNREGVAPGDSKGIGNVTADAAVGAGSVIAATAAGAAIGSVVPVAGTAVGAVAGFVVGAAVTYGAQISGVRDDIAKGVAAGVDELKHLF